LWCHEKKTKVAGPFGERENTVSEKIQKKDQGSGHFGKKTKVDMQSKNQNPPHPLRMHALNEKQP
jgi:hypothetical protein